jgi:hypothetical protein
MLFDVFIRQRKWEKISFVSRRLLLLAIGMNLSGTNLGSKLGTRAV